MNILWMTLCTCMIILVSMDWGLQSMSLDQHSLGVFRRYESAKTSTQLRCQKQYYAQLKRDWSGLQSISHKNDEALGDPVHIQENEPEDDSRDIKIFRFSAYPLNARFPISIRNFKAEATQTYWKEGFWNLLDRLYSEVGFYERWKLIVEKDQFITEMIEGIEQLSQSWTGVGTFGLLRLQFNSSEDQRVWIQLLKGSDLIGSGYPSLLAYVWASDLSSMRGVFPSKVNLPTASYEIIEAVFGEEFAQVWQEKVELEMQRRMSEGGYQVSLHESLIFESKKYAQILKECKNISKVPEQMISQFADTSAGNWQVMDEYLLKGPYLGRGYLATTLQIRSKEKR